MIDDPLGEREVSDLLEGTAPSRAPERLRTDIHGIARSTRQRPRWIALIKEPPMRISDHLAVGSPMARLSTTAAAGIALAVALTGAVLAASPSPSAPLVGASPSPSMGTPAFEVTGRFMTDRGTAAWTEEDTAVENGRRQRGAHYTGRTEMSDPRLSGDVTGTDNADRFCDGLCGPGTFRTDVHWGPLEISNEGGTWTGTMVGTNLTATDYELVGTGDYEGLSAIILETDPGNATEDGLAVLAWEGVVFPGELPPDRP